MLKAGRDTGSVMNHIYSCMAGPTPQVGMGMSIHVRRLQRLGQNGGA